MYRKLNPSGALPREISEVVNNLMEGKSNNTGTITVWDAALMANCVNHGSSINTNCLL